VSEPTKGAAPPDAVNTGFAHHRHDPATRRHGPTVPPMAVSSPGYGERRAASADP